MTEITYQNAINASIMNEWISYINAGEQTVTLYTRCLKAFAAYLRDNDISRPTKADIIAYREYLLATGRKAGTVQTYLAAVRCFFSWTADEGIYPNIAHSVTQKIDKGFRRDYLDIDSVHDLLGNIDRSTLKGKRDYAIMALMLGTGLRTISVITANVGDIKCLNGTTVLYYLGKGRTDKTEYVKVVGSVYNAIMDYLAARGNVQDSDPLFSSTSNRNTAERLTTRSIRNLVKESLRDIGLDSDRLSAHSLRHTAAVSALMAGASETEVQDLLGHASINTTRIYTHDIQKARRTAESKIDSFLFN